MKLGYDIIADLLNERFGIESPLQDVGCEFGLPGLVQATSDPADKDLLIVAASQRNRVAYKRDKLLILAGDDWPANSEQGMRSSSILVKSAKPETVFAEVLSLFSQVLEWETQIAEALERQSSLQTLLDITAQMLGNPVVFYDDRLEEYTLAISAADDALASQLYSQHESIKAGEIPLEMFNNEELQEYLAHSEPFLATYTYPGTRDTSIMLNAPVHEGGVHGIVGMRLLHGEIQRIHYRYIARLAHAIERYYRNTVARVASGRVGIHGALRGLLDGSVDRHTALQIAEPYIGENKDLVCVIARFADERSRNMPLSYLSEKIELALDERAAVFEMNGEILAVIWSFTTDSAFAAARQFASLIKPYGATAGCSNAFDSVITLPAHAVQANRALDLSNNETDALRLFSDVAVNYLLHYGATELEPRFLIAPGFSSLLAYNDSSTVDYIDTLRQFFVLGGNVSALARECGVNRSTLLFRLQQIESITDMHLNEPSDRLFLELSLHLHDN